MSRKLSVGIASYGKPDKLRRTVEALQRHCVTDWTLTIVSNPHPTIDNRELIAGMADRDCRIVPIWAERNLGYAGAVNLIMETAAGGDYVAYLDDDAYVETHAWDEALCSYLDRFHECGIIFPNGGPYMINRGAYQEVQWGVGFAWVINRMCATDVIHSPYGNGPKTLMDSSIGHQQECDLCLRIRMCGWKCAAAPEVHVRHGATATNDPASTERIGRGVMEFVNKWCRYFGGKNLNYHSPNVLRWEDWHPNALYMEEWWKSQSGTITGKGLPDGYVTLNSGTELNAEPDVLHSNGREYDLIRVPRFKGFYQGRII